MYSLVTNIISMFINIFKPDFSKFTQNVRWEASNQYSASFRGVIDNNTSIHWKTYYSFSIETKMYRNDWSMLIVSSTKTVNLKPVVIPF